MAFSPETVPTGIFTGRCFNVLQVPTGAGSSAGFTRRAALIKSLSEHGGTVLSRLETERPEFANQLVHVVVDTQHMPELPKTGAVYSGAWVTDCINAKALLQADKSYMIRAPPQQQPRPGRVAAVESPGPKRKRYTQEEDAALLAWVRDHPDIKASGRKLWQAAASAGVTVHSEQSMRERYTKRLINQTAAEEPAAVPRVPQRVPRRVSKPPPPADADVEAPAQSAAGMGMYDVEAVRARVRAMMDRYQQTEEEVLHALAVKSGVFSGAEVFLQMSSGSRNVEVARGWGAVDDDALKRLVHDDASSLPRSADGLVQLKGRSRADIADRCRFLGILQLRS